MNANDLTKDELENIRLCVASYLDAYEDMIFPELYQKIQNILKKPVRYDEGFAADKGLLE